MPTRRYDDSPGFGALYARTVKATLRRADYEPNADGLTLELPTSAIDQDHLTAYRDVTGFAAGPANGRVGQGNRLFARLAQLS